MRLLVLALFLHTICHVNAQELKIISKFQQIVNPDQPGTLIVLDLDETLIRPEGYIGSQFWYQDLVEKIRLENQISEDRAHKRAMRIWNKLQYRLKMQPLDPDTPEWIKQRQIQKTPVISLTARRPEIIIPTLNQLRALNIHFSPFPFAKHGLLFAGESKPKGQVLVQFLRKYTFVRRVIFVDDDASNHESVQAALAGMAIEYELYQLIDDTCSSLEKRP